MGRLQDKVAIITGGAQGQGAETSRVFVAEGAKVIITDVDTQHGEELARELGAAAIFLPLDVTDEEAWISVARKTIELHGRIDVLINNAGIIMSKAICDTTTTDIERMLQINVIGPFLGTKIVAPHMIKGGAGSIVNISSIQGLRASNGQGAYIASKWALRGFTKASAMELGHKGVRVNSIHPGGVNTVMSNPTGIPEEDFSKFMVDVPLQRIGKPIEIARVSAFLASDEASYITGAEIAVDGGATCGPYIKSIPGAPDAMMNV
jgi:3alpha(or 20beta)-hydroxysteroid dehydrogenase